MAKHNLVVNCLSVFETQTSTKSRRVYTTYYVFFIQKIVTVSCVDVMRGWLQVTTVNKETLPGNHGSAAPVKQEQNRPHHVILLCNIRSDAHIA